MTTPSRPSHENGWGETPPLPLTPDAKTQSRPAAPPDQAAAPPSPEVGGPRGPEPTRYNDWEQKGRCSDF